MEQQTIDNLKTLKTLLDSGVLTAEEYEKEKKSILREHDNNVSPNQANMTTQVQIEEPKQPVKSYVEKNDAGEKALLLWALIFVVTGIFRELIIWGDNFWYSNPSLKTIYFLLNIVECAGCILPTFAIKDKKYRLISMIVIGLLNLYYIFQNFQNIISQ